MLYAGLKQNLVAEAEALRRQISWCEECERRMQVLRCKQVADKMRSDDAVLQLQDEVRPT